MDNLIRLAAFNWLDEQVRIHGDTLSRNLLENGFQFQSQRITLIGPQGIWKPQIMSLPISITTSPDSPYDDQIGGEFIDYKYRGTDPYHPANVGLRELMRSNKPLIYFFGVSKGKYIASWPVYIIQDFPDRLTFKVAIDSDTRVMLDQVEEVDSTYYRRSYLTAETKIRLHQRSFRERVLHAYRETCAFCKLRHAELLDAAHIIEDRNELGDPVIQNGLALCKIHHAAFDRNIVGINPDYILKVREDVLEEIDGPMLKYGLQLLEKQKLILPRNRNHWPDKTRLEERYSSFLKAI